MMKKQKEILPPDYTRVRQTVLDTIAQHQAQKKPEVYSWFHQYMYDLSGSGWTRGDIYVLIHDVWESPMDEEHETDLLEYEMGITGFCAAECVTRLQGDPEGVEALATYVGTGEWKSGIK
jgi:hypothetical protein